MTDAPDPRHDDELIEDLDVPEDDADAIRGGMTPEEIKEKILKDPGLK